MRNKFFGIFFLFFAFSLYADSVYEVQKGDTLYSISRKYQITVNELRIANNLSESDVIPCPLHRLRSYAFLYDSMH